MLFDLIKKILRRTGSLFLDFCRWCDFLRYAARFFSYRSLQAPIAEDKNQTLLIVSLSGMNAVCAQIWTFYSIVFRKRGVRLMVITKKCNRSLDRYYKLMNMSFILYDEIEDRFKSSDLPEDLQIKLDQASCVSEYRAIVFMGIPIGDMTLSSYTRSHGSGKINFEDISVVQEIKRIAERTYRAVLSAQFVCQEYRITHLFFSDIFVDEYGPFFYTALAQSLCIIKITGTVRDNAILLHRCSDKTLGIHHGALIPDTWKKIKSMPLGEKILADLNQNFLDRYGARWGRSRRNHRNTKILSAEEARRILQVPEGKKVAVIYSHILYDNLFVYGSDLFEDYAEWFVETVRIACDNSQIEWFVKVHPSNLWRGELKDFLNGKYEEERLIAEKIGELPPHVRVIRADTQLNPYTWFCLADYGITVRGTSGLEMSALGKVVVTGGAGRYDGCGFTVDPKSREEYCDTLRRLQELPPLSLEQASLAKRYAYALFVLKPFEMTSLTPELRTGTGEFKASDDYIFIPKRYSEEQNSKDLKEFEEWVFNTDTPEYLADWAV